MFNLTSGIVVISIIVIIISSALFNNADNYHFPPKFKFGASTAAYQIEGGWNINGKGPNIWDTLTHEHPDLIADKSNGDIGPDSYHRFHQDLNAIKDLGLNFYRFSISWSRILPTGDVSSLNKDGIRYYNMIIDELLSNGIKPMVTMYHYDLPQEIQKIGGFTNPLFIPYFARYADILFLHFADRVKLWITFNEPFDYCVDGYGRGTIAPLVDASGIGEYLCVDNTLKAHEQAYHIYQNKYFDYYNGKIGITLSSRFYYSEFDDSEAVNRGMQFGLGWLANPLFSKNGDYPDVMINDITRNSKNEGRPESRLPGMSDHWRKRVKGTADFLGLNYYTSRYITRDRNDTPVNIHNPSWETDFAMKTYPGKTWKRGKSSWLYSYPQGLVDILRWIKDNYNNTEVYITENGWSDDGQLIDDDRIQYLQDHLKAVASAINDYGCKVSGYSVWSLIDNFEWMLGYTEKFGLYYVNLTSPGKERIAKKSAQFYKNIIKTRSILV